MHTKKKCECCGPQAAITILLFTNIKRMNDFHTFSAHFTETLFKAYSFDYNTFNSVWQLHTVLF